MAPPSLEEYLLAWWLLTQLEFSSFLGECYKADQQSWFWNCEMTRRKLQFLGDKSVWGLKARSILHAPILYLCTTILTVNLNNQLLLSTSSFILYMVYFWQFLGLVVVLWVLNLNLLLQKNIFSILFITNSLYVIDGLSQIAIASSLISLLLVAERPHKRQWLVQWIGCKWFQTSSALKYLKYF